MLQQFSIFESDEKIKINPFGRTFDNIETKELYEAVKAKTILENSSQYKSSKMLKLRSSPISSIGQFKIITSEDHITPLEKLQQFEYDDIFSF